MTEVVAVMETGMEIVTGMEAIATVLTAVGLGREEVVLHPVIAMMTEIAEGDHLDQDSGQEGTETDMAEVEMIGTEAAGMIDSAVGETATTTEDHHLDPTIDLAGVPLETTDTAVLREVATTADPDMTTGEVNLPEETPRLQSALD